MHPAFHQIRHRPWPLPNSPWILQQEWLDLLFVHWEVPAYKLRPLIPQPLKIDTFGDVAWIGVVPFSMRSVGPRGLPKPSFLSDFPEINVRTYVTLEGKPGVWFFSLDVPNRIPVWLARTFYHLPYFRAGMRVRRDSDDATYYTSTYRDRHFEASYRGGEPVAAPPGSFEHWATERYCLYSANRRGRIFRADIHHPKWELQQAELTIHSNTMLKPFPTGDRHPSLLFSKQLPVVAWPLKACT